MYPGHTAYHLDQKWQLRLATITGCFIIAGLLPFVPLSINASTTEGNLLGFCLLFPVTFVLCLIGSIFIGFARVVEIIVTPELLIYRFPGLTVRGRWNQVQPALRMRFAIWHVQGLSFSQLETRSSGQAQLVARIIGNAAIPIEAFLPGVDRSVLTSNLPASLFTWQLQHPPQQGRARQVEQNPYNDALTRLVQRMTLFVFGIIMVILFLWSFFSHMARQ